MLHILLTKADKLNKHQQLDQLKQVEAAYGSIATVQVFSGLKKTGDDIAREVITKMLNNPN
jgi:GTP-binding protein EngB required for normal cell division